MPTELEKEGIPVSSRVTTRSLDLRRYIPPAPPRPQTQNFSHIALVVDAVNKPLFNLPRDAEVRIGRQAGEGESVWHNLDLSEYDTFERSISRRHCRIFFEGNEYLIEDLGSTNGTWLNGRRLTPHKPTHLKTRDYIQVGQLGFWVFLPAVLDDSATPSAPQNNS